ncbi:MAG: peptidoglycan D,D-transpeptidase FtsI family protein [Elusimicrobiota bacterium]
MGLKIRLLFVSLILFLLFIGLGYRLCMIQIFSHDKLNKIARKSSSIKESRTTPKRGEILDSNGEVLAVNKHTYSVGFNPRYFERNWRVERDIASNINIGRNRLKRKIKEADQFIWIKKHVEPEKANKIFKYKKNGLVIVRENYRLYPKSPLASHVIGCVGIDNQGLSGIEFNFDSQLRDSIRIRKMLRDARGEIISFSMDRENVDREISNIQLSIDSNIQYIVENELKKGLDKYKANWGMAIVQDPHNGEILGMAVQSSYDNGGGAHSNVKKLKNFAVSNIFEPGSTFKIVTAAAAMEEGIVGVEEKIDCENGEYEIGGFPIRDFEPHGRMSFIDCMVYSSNIGLAKVGEKTGRNILYKYARNFGFGNFSGIRLPGETRGILRKPDRWSGTSLSRISFGQEVGVTGVQLVSAFSVIANGGILYEPRIVKKIWTDSKQRGLKPLPIRRVISKSTAVQLKDILKEVVKRGSGDQAYIKGYPVAGKTGTAQKFNPETFCYAEDKYVSLFGGFVPADDPEVTILVVYDEPECKSYWGGYVAAPVFSNIAKGCLNYMGVAPNIRESEYEN